MSNEILITRWHQRPERNEARGLDGSRIGKPKVPDRYFAIRKARDYAHQERESKRAELTKRIRSIKFERERRVLAFVFEETGERPLFSHLCNVTLSEDKRYMSRSPPLSPVDRLNNVWHTRCCLHLRSWRCIRDSLFELQMKSLLVSSSDTSWPNTSGRKRYVNDASNLSISVKCIHYKSCIKTIADFKILHFFTLCDPLMKFFIIRQKNIYSTKLRLNKRLSTYDSRSTDYFHKFCNTQNTLRLIQSDFGYIEKTRKSSDFHNRASTEVSRKTNIYLLCSSRSWYIE